MNPVPADARLRLVAAFALVLATALIARPLPAAFAAALALASAFAARLPAATWRRLLHAETFLILLLLTLPFAVPGREIAHLGPLTASAEGLARAGLIALKVSASVLILLTFLSGLDPSRLGAALAALKVPAPLIRVFTLTARYLGVVRSEATRLTEAMRARGFTPRSNRHTWTSYGNLMGMLLVRALDRAGRIEEAMRLRGDTGRYAALASAPARRDWAKLAMLLTIAFALFVGGRA